MKVIDNLNQTWKEFRRTKNPALREELVKAYAPLVSRIARKVAANIPEHVDRHDLESAGMMGLVESIDRFSPSAGTHFETYCCARIRGAMMDELREQDWLPRMLRIRIHKLDRAARRLELKHGRQATHAELAAALGISREKVKQALAYKSAVFFSLDRCRSNDSGDGVTDMRSLQDSREADPAQSVIKHELRSVIAEKLSEIERMVVMLYYYDGLTMKEIGEVLDVSESRVCQIHKEMIARLKRYLS